MSYTSTIQIAEAVDILDAKSTNYYTYTNYETTMLNIEDSVEVTVSGST